MRILSYSTSLLTFYIKGKIGFDTNFLRFKTPNTVLGFIPCGSKDEAIPINHLSSVETDSSVRLKKLLTGILFVIGSFFLFYYYFILGIPAILLGLFLILDAFEIYLKIYTTSGKSKQLRFIVFHKKRAFSAENEINKLIEDRMNDTNVRIQTDRIIDAINRK